MNTRRRQESQKPPKRLSAICDVQGLGRGDRGGDKVKRPEPTELPGNIAVARKPPSVFLLLHVILGN